MKNRMIALGLTPAILLLTGCPADEPDHPYEDDLPRAAEAPPPERQTERIQLVSAEHPGFPGVVGHATLMALTVDETDVSIYLEHAPPDEEVHAGIYREQCGRGAPSAWPLGIVAIDPDGEGIHTFTVPEPLDVVLDGLEAGDLFVQVRDGEGEPIACGPPVTGWEREPRESPVGRERGDPFPPPADREEMVDPNR